jgi:putative FmdB family regulatory protein
MPTYEYRCTQCHHLFDIHQAVGEAAPKCPQCGSPTKKVFASVGLIFKGSGFHTTDYRKAPAGNGSDAKSGDSAKETKPSSDAASSPEAGTSTSTSGESSSKPSKPSATSSEQKS